MSKLGISLNLLIVFSTLVLIVSPDTVAKIVGSGTATPVSLGTGSGVTSITQGSGLSFSTNPLIATGTISLAQAINNVTIGGVRVANCSFLTSVVGWDTAGSPICGITSLEQITLGIGLGSNETPITFNSTLFLKNASSTEIGGVRASNCSGTDKLNGITGGGVFTCGTDLFNDGTVTDITQGTGMSFSVSPLTISGTISLAEALTGTRGGVKIINCSAGSFISGYGATVIPTCTIGGTGTITSIASGEGIVVNPSPIISTGTIMGANATTSVRGIVQVANCTSTDKVSGWSAGNIPICTTDTTGSGSTDYQVMWNGRTWGTLRPLGTTATTFTATNWAAFIPNGTAAAHALANDFYIRYTGASAINGSAGITQTAIQTQFRYRPIIRTSVMTNATNADIKYWMGISNQLFPFYFSARGTDLSASITFNTNSSNTDWMCCTNDGTALGSSCISTGISMTTNSPYNLTLNLSNYPTDVRCLVQNNTASATITKTTNIPADTGVNLAVANVALSQTTTAVVYSIRGMYFESK